MEQTRYRVILEGTVQQGENLARVKERLTDLFKAKPELIEQLFSQAPRVIKQHLDRETAFKYRAAVEETGALCRVEAEQPAPAGTSPATPARPQAPPPPPRQDMPPPVPPSTGSPPPYPPPPPPPASQQAVPPPVPPAPGTQPQRGGTFYREPSPSPVSKEPDIPKPVPYPQLQSFEKKTLKSLGTGFLLAVIVSFLPFLSFIFQYVVILLHEFGHAVVGWFYGYPSIPAFDFLYGGGITTSQDRKTILIIVLYAIFAFLLYFYRRKPATLGVLAGLILLHSIINFTSAHEVVIIFMGHGFELLFAIVFWYRALSGSGIIIEVERPLYAFLGFFIFFGDTKFAYRLMTSPAYRVEYGEAKGGGHWMDFSRIAIDYFRMDLSSVAGMFFFLCLLTPLAAFLIYRYKQYFGKMFRELLTPE